MGAILGLFKNRREDQRREHHQVIATPSQSYTASRNLGGLSCVNPNFNTRPASNYSVGVVQRDSVRIPTYPSRPLPPIFRPKIVQTKDEWSSSSNSAYYFHYTSVFNARCILRDKIINTSQARIPCFGRGVFMTMMGPDLSDHELIENNYRGNYKYQSKTECAFGILKSSLGGGIKKIYDKFGPHRDVWRFDYAIDLNTVKYVVVIRSAFHSYIESELKDLV